MFDKQKVFMSFIGYSFILVAPYKRSYATFMQKTVCIKGKFLEVNFRSSSFFLKVLLKEKQPRK